MIDINANARPLKMQPEGFLATEQPITQNSFPAREDVPNVLPSPLQKVWDELAAHHVLGEVVEVHGGSNYPLRAQEQENSFFSAEPRPGWARGIAQITDDFEPYRLRTSSYLKSAITQPSPQLPWEKPKVLAHVDGSPNVRWPIVAAVDEEGLLCTQDFFAIWPTGELPVEVLAAILNGPIANAWLSARRTDVRDIKRLLMQVPIPNLTRTQINIIHRRVRGYCRIREEWLADPEQAGNTGEGGFELLGEDILGYSQLSRAAEQELIAYFAGHKRPGPFSITTLRHSLEHEMHRTILHVWGVRNEKGEKVVDVFIFGWGEGSPDKIVHFPLSLVPKPEQAKIHPDMGLWANVNLGTTDEKNLVFEQIEVVPPISEEFRAKFAILT